MSAEKSRPRKRAAPAAAKPTTYRRNYGSGHGYFIDGQKADGVTSILSGGIPKPALVGWAAGAVAGVVYDDFDFVAQMVKKSNRDGFIKWAKELPSQDRDTAAKRGTEVHKLAERLAKGEKDVEVPDELVGHVDAYLKFRDDFDPEDEIVEFVCFNRSNRYGGTGDLIATVTLPRETTFPTGNTYPAGYKLRAMIDLKTNRSGPFAEVALQIAGYRFAEFIIDEDGNEVDMPEVEETLCLWLRADGYDLIPFRATQEEFEFLLYAQQVAYFSDWKNGHARLVKGDALAPPERKSK